MPDDDVIRRMEAEYASTQIITIVRKNGVPPSIEWDQSLSEDQVIACLYKALMILTVDEYLDLELLDDDEEIEE